MKVLLTGASGFIGYHVAKTLLEKGHHVAALVMPDDPMPRLQNLLTSLEIVQSSLGETAVLKEFINSYRPEACIHLAWYAEPGKYLDAEQNLQSLSESLSLFNILIAAECRQIAAAGTCFEYDTTFGYLREDSPTNPASLYAASKLSCWLMGHQLAVKVAIRLAWGRIFYPYGPLEDERRLVPAAIKALKQGLSFQASTGEQIRDYIHVADVASAFCTLIEKEANGIFNISTGTPVSVGTVLKTIERGMNRPGLIHLGALPARPWEPPFICGDSTKLRQLGWNPRYSLDEGLQDTIDQTHLTNGENRLS